MGDRVETNQSTTKLDPKETHQRLVAVGKGGVVERGKAGTTAWWRNAREWDKERKGRQMRPRDIK